MKKSSLLVLSIAFFINVFAQKTEFRLVLNSGLSSFYGKNAASVSIINAGSSDGPGNVANPFGSANAWSYGASINVQRVTKKNLIFGTGLGYDQLRSKVIIDGVETVGGIHEAHGFDYLNTKFINANPYLGYRMNISKISFDVTGGFDIAYCLSAHESAFLVNSAGAESPVTSDLNQKPLNFDFRPQLQVAISYNTFGVYVGYSYGISNYFSGYSEAYSRLIRFGVSYQIK